MIAVCAVGPSQDDISPLWRLPARRDDHIEGHGRGVVVTAIGERRRAARGGARLDTRALVVFFALAYALSWTWAIPLAAAHQVVRREIGRAHV